METMVLTFSSVYLLNVIQLPNIFEIEYFREEQVLGIILRICLFSNRKGHSSKVSGRSGQFLTDYGLIINQLPKQLIFFLYFWM